jgi:hypothetical protein
LAGAWLAIEAIESVAIALALIHVGVATWVATFRQESITSIGIGVAVDAFRRVSARFQLSADVWQQVNHSWHVNKHRVLVAQVVHRTIKYGIGRKQF